MKLADLVATSAAVAGTRSRLKKRELLAACLRAASPEEVALVVNYLGGTLPQGKIGIGYAMLRDLDAQADVDEASLDLAEVDATFTALEGVSGAGSKARRQELLGDLLGRAAAAERDFLVRLILGELRQGALEGVLVDALADATGIAADAVRRAIMLAADPAAVALVALGEGKAGLARFRLEPMSPVKPMLASPADDVEHAMTTLGAAALEYKLDGARVQVHRDGDDVRVFTRALNEVTERVPEVVEAARGLDARSFILDGEVIALRDDGRPLPFQVTMRRFGRSKDVEDMRRQLPLSVFLFDCLYLDGRELIDEGYDERAAVLEGLLAPEQLVPRMRATDTAGAAAFLTRALEEGHEGIMAKAPGSPYAAGSRGADWLKIKQAHTLDLVIIAAEWGSGRRRGWLSNLHLGARDPDDGGFVMLGKTFKGLTDKMLEWQTGELKRLAVREEDYVVHVRPELVVEIAVNDIQASPQYPAGMALRFARVKRHRRDKTAAEADTIGTVRQLFERQST